MSILLLMLRDQWPFTVIFSKECYFELVLLWWSFNGQCYLDRKLKAISSKGVISTNNMFLWRNMENYLQTPILSVLLDTKQTVCLSSVCLAHPSLAWEEMFRFQVKVSSVCFAFTGFHIHRLLGFAGNLLGFLSHLEDRKIQDNIRASSWDFGTYHIGNQRRLKQACASMQFCQSLRFSLTWSMEVDEGSDQKLDI